MGSLLLIWCGQGVRSSGMGLGFRQFSFRLMLLSLPPTLGDFQIPARRLHRHAIFLRLFRGFIPLPGRSESIGVVHYSLNSRVFLRVHYLHRTAHEVIADKHGGTYDQTGGKPLVVRVPQAEHVGVIALLIAIGDLEQTEVTSPVGAHAVGLGDDPHVRAVQCALHLSGRASREGMGLPVVVSAGVQMWASCSRSAFAAPQWRIRFDWFILKMPFNEWRPRFVVTPGNMRY